MKLIEFSVTNFRSITKAHKIKLQDKKEYKESYMPKTEPTIVTIPKMNYIAVRGQGDPTVPSIREFKAV